MRVRLRHNGESEPTHKVMLHDNSVGELIHVAYDRLGRHPGASDQIIFYDREGDQVRRQDCQDGDEIWVAFGGEPFMEPSNKRLRRMSSSPTTLEESPPSLASKV